MTTIDCNERILRLLDALDAAEARAEQAEFCLKATMNEKDNYWRLFKQTVAARNVLVQENVARGKCPPISHGPAKCSPTVNCKRCWTFWAHQEAAKLTGKKVK